MLLDQYCFAVAFIQSSERTREQHKHHQQIQRYKTNKVKCSRLILPKAFNYSLKILGWFVWRWIFIDISIGGSTLT